MSGDRRRTRLVAAAAASILLLATATTISRVRTDTATAGAAPNSATATTSPTPGPPRDLTGGDAPADDDVPAALRAPGDAAAVPADRLISAGAAAAAGAWRSLGNARWPVEERPVYVAEVDLGADRVEADVVIAWRVERPLDEVVLRLLAASAALQRAGAVPDVDVSLDGAPADATLDGDGARLVIAPRGPLEDGSAHMLRIRIAYDLVPAERIDADGGPAAFGLLARTPAGATLGHWLPLLTLPGEDGPMIPWGDVGGFPAAVWSVRIHHDGAVVTGGSDGPCPDRPAAQDGCTWARGIALRDVSAVWFARAPHEVADVAGGLSVRAFAPASADAAGNGIALDETVASLVSFQRRFGPLAWNEFDVVAAPLGRGAAGMEFPGLVLIDTGAYGDLGGGFGTFVIAHEAAHQWFHALVGSGSLSSPVVDESLAQYLSYLFWADRFGEGAAGRLAESAFLGRYDAARQAGIANEPPAQPLAEFDDADAYGPLVYGRGAQAWVAAEGVVGRDRVVAFLAGIVDRYGLERISDERVVEEARDLLPELADVLERYWFDPAPIGAASG